MQEGRWKRNPLSSYELFIGKNPVHKTELENGL